MLVCHRHVCACTQDRFARPQQQRGAPGGGDRPSPRQDSGGYGARGGDRGAPRPARGGDGGGHSGMGAELSAMSSWDARRGGGAGAGDAADRDRFLSAEELEDRERKEKQVCAGACAATPGSSPLCSLTLKGVAELPSCRGLTRAQPGKTEQLPPFMLRWLVVSACASASWRIHGSLLIICCGR